MTEGHEGPHRVAGLWGRLRRYFADRIWRVPEAKESRTDRTLRRLARTCYIVVRGCRDDAVRVRAGTLTYQIVLALVPLLALVISISKGLVDLQRPDLESLVAKVVPDPQMAVSLLTYVENTDLTALGAIGMLALLYLSISVLSNIEQAFNAVWAVSESRPWRRKFTDYLSILLVWPVLVLASTSLTTSSFVTRLLENRLVSEATRSGEKLLPLLAVWLAFTFVYFYMPNTRVRLRAALVGGVLAGTLWQVTQWAYIHFQVGVTRYNAIYGTVASFPMFLVWINISWIIVLGGSEIAYAVQHEQTYHPPVKEKLSIADTETAALQFLARVWGRFHDGEAALTAGDLAAEVELPRPSSLRVLDSLVGCGLLAHDKGGGLLPARELGAMSVGDLLLRFRHGQPAIAGARRFEFEAPTVALHRRLEEAFRTAGRSELAELTAARAAPS